MGTLATCRLARASSPAKSSACPPPSTCHSFPHSRLYAAVGIWGFRVLDSACVLAGVECGARVHACVRTWVRLGMRMSCDDSTDPAKK